MISRLCLISGPEADATACLLSQILARRGRTAMCALGRGYEGELSPWLRALEQRRCPFGVCALPEGIRPDWYVRAGCAVFLSRSAGEAAAGELASGADAILNLDDPEGVPKLPDGVRRWTISERRNSADVSAKNLRLRPFRTQFEAVTRDDICRLSVPLPEGRGLYPGLAAACAALTFGMGLNESAAALEGAEPVPLGMIPLPLGGPNALAGYFEAKK
ncbi:MAG: hypothetical protein IJ751_08470 [Oscillospiraceae bacterium]|nr:hypothetical protein [Oscillospiraceae bacterium]